MVATAIMSMWISNTATAVMMLPIAMAVVGTRGTASPTNGFPTALLLGIAYGASIGGIATLIGTPPNAILAAAASEILGVEIGFFQWMGVGLPLVAVMLPVTWILLTRFLYPPGRLSGDAEGIIADEAAAPEIVGGRFVLWTVRVNGAREAVAEPSDTEIVMPL